MSVAFQIISDPVKRRILELLIDSKRSSGEVVDIIQDEFNISQPAVSQHLKSLRNSGFAQVQNKGTKRIYTLNAAPLQEVDAWLYPFRDFFENRLQALHTEVARGKKRERTRDLKPDEKQ